AKARAGAKRSLRLRIVGDGPMRTTLEKQAGILGLSDEVEFAGLVTPERMPEEFQDSDLFCFPSIREFGGAVVLEAMAAGVPCVVVDHGGIGEYVTPACGIKIRPESRDYLVAKFAESLVALSADESLLGDMGEAAVRRAHEFSWEAKVRRIEAIIGEAIDEKAGGRRLAA
ncbi:MAG: glycosyltransferase, partial [Verrucomicrobiales bacterium]